MAPMVEIITKLNKAFKVLFLENLVQKFELPSFLRNLFFTQFEEVFFESRSCVLKRL